MATETNQDETSQPPFQFGDVVRHQSGDVIKVEACKRVVAHSHLRWAVYDANGNRFWARNCGLVERPRATPDDFLGVSAIDGTKVYSASPADLRAEIETLAKQRDEAREELKEATAEFVRALSSANRELVLERAEHAGAKAALKKAIEVASGWSERIAAAHRVLDGKAAE